MCIPKYYFSFDEFIEKNLKVDHMSKSKMIDACYKEIDRVDNIPKNRLNKYEWDSLINYRTLLNGLPHFLGTGVTSNGEIAEKKYQKIEDAISKTHK